MIMRLISDCLVKAGWFVSSVGVFASCVLSSFWSVTVGVVGVSVGDVAGVVTVVGGVTLGVCSGGLLLGVSKLQLPKHDAKLMATCPTVLRRG